MHREVVRGACIGKLEQDAVGVGVGVGVGSAKIAKEMDWKLPRN